MKTGIYRCDVERHYVEEDVPVGHITIKLNVSAAGKMSMSLIENTVRYDAPQIDDMFYGRAKVSVGRGTQHGLVDWEDGTFTLYPYRIGTPYLFRKEAQTDDRA